MPNATPATAINELLRASYGIITREQALSGGLKSTNGLLSKPPLRRASEANTTFVCIRRHSGTCAPLSTDMASLAPASNGPSSTAQLSR